MYGPAWRASRVSGAGFWNWRDFRVAEATWTARVVDQGAVNILLGQKKWNPRSEESADLEFHLLVACCLGVASRRLRVLFDRGDQVLNSHLAVAEHH